MEADADSVELEDGELIDEESEDTFGGYNVLKRPTTVVQKHEVVNDSDETDNDDTSDSGSDSDCKLKIKVFKMGKMNRRKCRVLSKETYKKQDKYKIWCTQVQEEALTENLESCGVTKKLHQGRSVENYDLPSNYFHHHRDNGFNNKQSNSSDDDRDTNDIRTNNKRSHSDRSNVKLRLGKRLNSMDVDNQKGSVRIISQLSTDINSTNDELANDIAEKLSEKKDCLVQRIVDVIGKEKAIEFYEKTIEIEANGGMLIMNGSRRRTPGGVYFTIIKNDQHIPQEQIREIFAVDKKEMNTKKKKLDALKMRKKTQKLMKNLENGSNNDLPGLLTRAELSTQQIAEEARLRRGGMDKISLDSDITVSNPPPSPVTDDPDNHLEHVVTNQRTIQDYSDDFLDICVNIDSMETF